MAKSANGQSSIRDRVIGLRRVRAGSLLPHSLNYRRHPKAQRAALAGVMREIGYAGALLAYETPEGLRLIDGHLRAELTPEQEVPVLVLDVNETEAHKLLATYDTLGAMAQPDSDALMALLQDVHFESPDVTAMLEALANGETQPMPNLHEAVDSGVQIDRAAVLQEKWQTAKGQVWEVPSLNCPGKTHRLMCGDSEKEMMLLLGEAKLDAVFTDPPYGINIVKGLSSTNAAKPFGRVRPAGGRAVGMPSKEPVEPTGSLRYLSKQFQRLGHVGGAGVVEPRLYHPVYGDDKSFDPTWLLGLASVVALFGANHYASRLPDSSGWLVWDKGVSPESTFSACELIWTNQNTHCRKYDWRWSGMVRQGSREVEMDERIHPTQKPVGLFEEILRDLTQPGDLVFDPYLGSGTTMIATERTGRICIGGEYDEGYVAVVLERMADMGLKPRLVNA